MATNKRNSDIDWSEEAQKYGPRITNWGWRMYNQPSAALTAEAAPTAASGTGTIGASGVAEGAGLAGGYGTASTGAGTGTTAGLAPAAGESSLSGLGGVSWATYAPYLSVIAPAIMAYSAYTSGSGVNEPIRKKYETAGAIKLLKDLAAGKEVDPANVYAEYGLRPKYLSQSLDPNAKGNEGFVYEQTVDPRGYSAYDLYDLMHSYTTGRPQTGGLGNAGWSDAEVDSFLGGDKDKVAKLLGVSGLPDWSNHNWNRGLEGTTLYDLQPQVALNKGWEALSPEDRNMYLTRAQSAEGGPANEDVAKGLWAREKEKADLENFRGGKLNLLRNY